MRCLWQRHVYYTTPTLGISQVQPFKLLLRKSHALFVTLLLIVQAVQSCGPSSSFGRSSGRSGGEIAVALSVIAR